MKTEWVTYIRYGRGTERSYITKLASERRPVGFASQRPATKSEVAAARRKQRSKQRYIDALLELKARPEYEDAERIRVVLEMMDVDDHPLDRLTPEEWRVLRGKICGN